VTLNWQWVSMVEPEVEGDDVVPEDEAPEDEAPEDEAPEDEAPEDEAPADVEAGDVAPPDEVEPAVVPAGAHKGSHWVTKSEKVGVHPAVTTRPAVVKDC